MENLETKRFGRYEVVGELGRGAMGVVYKARDPQIDRLVAVKTVSLWGQEPDAEKEFRLRFMNEAQAAGRLHHSGIVGVFDVGENPENQDPYIVLEYVAGESLNKVLAREKKLPLPNALQLAVEIADALEYAHAQGVVHRDIKPANILVAQNGHAKIADFGIAKLNLAHFTLPGRVLGTPAYMAPEQLSGEGADGRSDLFSLGVILYAMVTGHSPFQGNSATTVCFKVANREPIAASALDMTLPPQLDAVIGRAMAKNPEERYQRGAEFSEDLQQLQQLLLERKPGSTTTSLQAAAAGTKSGAARTGNASFSVVPPAKAVAQAEKVVRHILFKAPIRDLVLGAATIVVLVILAAQTKLLVSSSKVPVNGAAPAASSSSASIPESANPVIDSPQTEPPKPASPPHAAAKKVAAKPAHAAKQILVPSSTLDLAVQHQFKDATLFVWVDDKLALTRPLHGGAQKRLVVFNGIRGIDSESLTVPAGKHVLRFRALSGDQTVDLSKTVAAEFIGGDTKSLQLTFDKHNTAMRLAWQ
ncbi:MAG: serine/threonine-protein kinase [Candidatus Sulfotelmatobacter sp.]